MTPTILAPSENQDESSSAIWAHIDTNIHNEETIFVLGLSHGIFSFLCLCICRKTSRYSLSLKIVNSPVLCVDLIKYFFKVEFGIFLRFLLKSCSRNFSIVSKLIARLIWLAALFSAKQTNFLRMFYMKWQHLQKVNKLNLEMENVFRDAAQKLEWARFHWLISSIKFWWFNHLFYFSNMSRYRIWDTSGYRLINLKPDISQIKI